MDSPLKVAVYWVVKVVDGFPKFNWIKSSYDSSKKVTPILLSIVVWNSILDSVPKVSGCCDNEISKVIW